MRFEIRGDKGKIKILLLRFIDDATKEYVEQSRKFSGVLPPVAFSFSDIDGGYMFLVSFNLPSFMGLFRNPIRKMEENLRMFFKSNGVDVDVRYVGD